MQKVYPVKNNSKTSLILILMMLCFGVTEAFAQKKAIVKGTVKDDSGQLLPGVNVVVAGSYSGVSTDPRGEYSIFVSPGAVELEFSFIGNETKKESIQVAEGETKVLDVVLASSVIQLSEVFVVGSLEGQQKALNQQRTADNLKNIVAADQIGRFPDQNSAEALQRLPGINVQRDEGDGRFVLVRGLAPQYTNISVNGEQIPSPDAGARFVALDAIPANQLASLEVTKAITPDMDGDAIGGSVNLVTQTASSQELQLSASLGLEYNANATKVAPQGNLSISKRTADNKFGFIANGSYASSKKKSDRYNFDGWGDDPNGLSEFVPGDYEITRNRLGLSATLDYKFNEKNTIYLRSLYSELRELELRREFQFEGVYNEDDDENEYEVKKELKDRPENQGVYSFNLGGTSIGSKLKFDYELAYAKAFQDTPWNRYTVFENSEDVEWGMDLETKLNPKITGFMYDGAPADYRNSDLYEFDSFEESSTLAEDQNITAKINFAIPLALGENSGELKFGGKTRFKDKSFKFRYFTNYSDYSGPEDLILTDYQSSYTDETFMDGDFGSIGYFPERGFRNFVQSNIADFDEIEEVEDEVAMESYEASENVYAAYVQGKIQFKKLMVLAGVRYEKTTVDYKSGIWDTDLEEALPVEGENDYGFLLPMVHLKYSIDKNTNIRAAVTQSYARPNFEDLVQGGEYNPQDNEANLGNPDLVPVKSLNLDLFGEHYLGTVGIISGGVFYKKLDDFIYKKTTDETFLGTPDVEVTQSVNGENGSLFGFELAWQQNLTFLPGVLSGLGIYANYTFTKSEAEVEDFAQGEDLTEIELPGQSKHIGNIALSYTKGGFNSRISLNYNGKFISEIDGDDLILIDNRAQLDISLSQTIAKKYTIFAELVNLTNEEQHELYNTRSTPSQRELYGFWTRFGVKFKL